MIANYLSPADYTVRIGHVTASLTQAELEPYWVQFCENQLVFVLPKANPFWTWYASPARASDAKNTSLDEALRRWAVYATWSMYIMQGDARQTASGLTVKKTEESVPLSDRQRAELHRRYADMAYRHETLFLALLRPATATLCEAPQSTRRSRRIRVVGKPNPDRFI